MQECRMVRFDRLAAAVFSAILVAVLTCPAAGQARADDASSVGFFDGAAADAPAALTAPVLGAFKPSGPAMSRPSKRSSADLYYFTPEEAARAAKQAEAQGFSTQARGYVIDSNVPPEIQQQLRDDLAFIKGIQGRAASKLHQGIFGAVDGAAYTDFFESRVKGIGMGDCGDSNAVACVIPMFGHSRMWLTQNYVKFSHPQIARLMVVFHEARHTEMLHLFWSHATCPKPFLGPDGREMKSIWTGASLAGEPACDKTPQGSYGSSMIMLKNIQKFCSNCTDKVRMDAGLYADDQFGRVIDAGARKQIQQDLYR